MCNVNLDNAAQVFREFPGVVAAWAFGSAADGAVRPGGDLDLGVLFASEPDLDTLCDLRAALTLALRTENVDLVPLNGASSLLRFQAVSGRLLCSNDDGARATFVSLAAREHEDDMALADRHLRQMPRR